MLSSLHEEKKLLSAISISAPQTTFSWARRKRKKSIRERWNSIKLISNQRIRNGLQIEESTLSLAKLGRETRKYLFSSLGRNFFFFSWSLKGRMRNRSRHDERGKERKEGLNLIFLHPAPNSFEWGSCLFMEALIRRRDQWNRDLYWVSKTKVEPTENS